MGLSPVIIIPVKSAYCSTAVLFLYNNSYLYFNVVLVARCAVYIERQVIVQNDRENKSNTEGFILADIAPL